MSKSAGIIISFLLGGAVGASVSYFVLSDKYEKEKDEFYEKEVKPAREEYFQKIKEASEQSKENIELNRAAKEKISETLSDLNAALGYVTESKEIAEEETEKEPEEDHLPPIPNPVDINGPDPYFISADDFADENGYSKQSFVYHANQIVINDKYEVIDDVERLIGEDNFNRLPGMLDKRVDICWIRNDNTSVDYEIQLADYDFND